MGQPLEPEMPLTTITAARAALLTRMENTPPRYRRRYFAAPEPITTAEELFARKLSGIDLEEAFDALSLKEQSRYLADPRCRMGMPCELCCV